MKKAQAAVKIGGILGRRGKESGEACLRSEGSDPADMEPTQIPRIVDIPLPGHRTLPKDDGIKITESVTAFAAKKRLRVRESFCKTSCAQQNRKLTTAYQHFFSLPDSPHAENTKSDARLMAACMSRGDPAACNM